MSVDGTDYSVYEQPMNKRKKRKQQKKGKDGRLLKWNPKWYSHKYEGPGVRYETAVNIQSGDIVWINGPFPAGKWPDAKIFKHRLRSMLDDDEMVEADNTYKGMPYDVRLPNNYVNQADKVAKEQALARHETIHCRLKQFGILGSKFRHQLKYHKIIHKACASLVQLSIDHNKMIFYTYY